MNKNKKCCSTLSLKAGPQTFSGSPLIERLSPEGWPVLVLTIVLCSEIFEGSKAITARHVLLKLLLQGFETDAVLLVRPELGDVKAGGMRHVDHVSVGEHGELIFLEETREV